MEIQEIIRRWQAGEGPRQIAAGTGLSRNTVRKYLAAARLQGVTQGGPATTEDQLSRLATISRVGPRQVQRRPDRTSWSRGRTRSTSGSPKTGCR